MPPIALLARARKALAAAADPARAPGMQAYMKSEMPYHGVSSVPFKKLAKELLREHAFTTREAWEADVLAVWRGARFREERYVALHLAGDKRAAAFRTPAALSMYEELVTSGAWWDYVDDIATHQIGPMFEAHERAMKPKMLAWSRSPDMWKARTSIICQVARKGKTDLQLLYTCIEPSLASKEFFLRKAIGWALRAYAWHDPAEIVRYVNEQGERLSGLSRREALINVEGRRKPSRGR